MEVETSGRGVCMMHVKGSTSPGVVRQRFLVETRALAIH